jgi:hypothetical protein
MSEKRVIEVKLNSRNNISQIAKAQKSQDVRAVSLAFCTLLSNIIKL